MKPTSLRRLPPSTADRPPSTVHEISSLMIDADVHNELPKLKTLLPYLGEQWQVYLNESAFRGTGAADYPDKSPVASREDARPDSGPPGSDIDLLRKHVFDDGGADLAILNCGFRAGSVHNQDLAADLATAVNDWQVEQWLNTDDRFRASIIVANQNPVRAAAEIDRIGSHPGFIQVVLPVCGDAPYGNLRYDPVFDAATRHDLAILIAFGGASGFPPTGIGWPSTYVEEYVDAGATFQSQINSLIFEGAFDRFPTLRIVLSESGWTWMPSLMWRMDKEWKGLRRDTPWVKRPPSDYMREHIHLTTAPTDRPSAERSNELIEIIDYLNSDKMLLFASDYPHWHGEEPMAWLSDLPEDLKERILHLNAAEFYGLEVSATA